VGEPGMTAQGASNELPSGIRMKGGVAFNPDSNGFVAIVHSWDNVDCLGEPSEWISSKVFPTENAAMRYYKKAVRPALKKAMRKASRMSGIDSVEHRELE
jgi:hypothetical protein